MNDKVINALVELAKQRNHQSFSILYEHYHLKLIRFLISLFGRGEFAQDIEDVAQQAWFKAWTSIPKFRGDSSFSTWLCKIGKNTFLSHVAHERRHGVTASNRVELDAERAIDDADISEMSTATSPEQCLVAKMRAKWLDEQLSAMPPELREAFYLREYELLSYEEIAQKLRIPIGTVRSRVHRAREQLGQP